jgi:cardiolipin synthase
MNFYYIILILHLAVALPVCVHVLLTKRETSAPTWLALVLISPFLGAGLYWILGINRVERRARRLRGRRPRYVPQIKDPVLPFAGLPTQQQRQMFHYETAVHDAPFLGGNDITPLINAPQVFPAMLDAIAAATSNIALSVYIFQADEVGCKFIEALRAAHKRGVKVRVLIDEVGSGTGEHAADRPLAADGIPTARFIPQKLKFLPVVNLRNHRKIMMVDGAVGFIGGMNICLNYGRGSGRRRREAVRDIHFRVTGPVIAQMNTMFEEDWRFATDEVITLPVAPCDPAREREPQYARIVPDGPDNPFQRTLWIMLGALAFSQKSVHILTPYFLPNPVLSAAIAVAALRGVDVRVVVPERSDIALVDWAMRAKFQDLIEQGVKVYTSGAPFDHSKLMVVDDVWVLVGSSNWDQRSLRLNFEANLECYDADLAGTMEAHFQRIAGDAELVSLVQLQSLPWNVRLRNNIARLFVPYL